MAAASVWQWSMRPESTRQTWPVHGFGDHVLDDERVARRVACDGGEHRRVVLRTGVEVLEVRLDAVDVGHREDARRDQLVVRDGDERRTQEQVEQRGQPVLPFRRRGEAEPVPRGQRSTTEWNVLAATWWASSRMSRPKPPRKASSFDRSQRTTPG